jgi:hypothetical protein
MRVSVPVRLRTTSTEASVEVLEQSGLPGLNSNSEALLHGAYRP